MKLTNKQQEFAAEMARHGLDITVFNIGGMTVLKTHSPEARDEEIQKIRVFKERAYETKNAQK